MAKVTDAGVDDLASMRALKSLNLYHTLLTEKGLARLKTALPDCGIVFDRTLRCLRGEDGDSRAVRSLDSPGAFQYSRAGRRTGLIELDRGCRRRCYARCEGPGGRRRSSRELGGRLRPCQSR